MPVISVDMFVWWFNAKYFDDIQSKILAGTADGWPSLQESITPAGWQRAGLQLQISGTIGHIAANYF